MRTFTLAVFVTMLLPLVGVGQNWELIDCENLPSSFICSSYSFLPAWGDTINPIEDPVFFGSDTTGLWQFGYSYKPVFDSISTFTGWITDTIENYGLGKKSWFEIENTNFSGTAWILFEHRYSTDSLLDAGYVEYWDYNDWQVLTWDIGTNDPLEEGIHFHNYVGLPDDTLGTIRDSVPAFTGRSNGWIWSGFEIFDGGSAIQGDENQLKGKQGGGYRFRFVFESDSIQGSTAGWMIRNIVLGWYDLGGSVSEVNYKNLSVYPNPTNSTLRIQLPENNLSATRTRIYDMTGRLVHQQAFNPNMDVGYLDSGTYIVVVETEEGNFRGTVQKE